MYRAYFLMSSVDNENAEMSDYSLFTLQFCYIEKIQYRSTGDQCSHYKLATLAPVSGYTFTVDINFVDNANAEIHEICDCMRGKPQV